MKSRRIIRAGNLIDGTGGEIRRNVFIALENQKIAAIGPVAELQDNVAAEIDDYSYCTVLPPLIDCSVWLARSPALGTAEIPGDSLNDSLSKRASLVEKHLSYCYGYGVLGVVENEDISGEIDSLRRRGDGGDVVAISLSHGGTIQGEASTDVESHKRCLKRRFSQDIGAVIQPASQIAEPVKGSFKSPGSNRIVGIANGPEDVRKALSQGCEAIEQGYFMGEENLKEMAQKEILWIPSILRAKNGLDGSAGGGDICCRFSQRYVAPGKPLPGAESYWKKALEYQLLQLRLARKLGVRTAVGTGAGTMGILHGESVVEEMKLFMKAGYTLEEVVQCATETGADFFFMSHLGALKVGSPATFLLTRGSVKQLPRKLSFIEAMYVQGSPARLHAKSFQ